MCRKKTSWDSSWCLPYCRFWASRINALVGALNCTACTRWACTFSVAHPDVSASAFYWLPWAWSHQLHQWAACTTHHRLCGRKTHVLTTMCSLAQEKWICIYIVSMICSRKLSCECKVTLYIRYLHHIYEKWFLLRPWHLYENQQLVLGLQAIRTHHCPSVLFSCPTNTRLYVSWANSSVFRRPLSSYFIILSSQEISWKTLT